MILLKIVFIAFAIGFIVIAIYCNAIYDWGTACARKWGWNGIVKIRERMKHWALPFSQVLLILIAIAYLIAAIFIP